MAKLKDIGGTVVVPNQSESIEGGEWINLAHPNMLNREDRQIHALTEQGHRLRHTKIAVMSANEEWNKHDDDWKRTHLHVNSCSYIVQECGGDPAEADLIDDGFVTSTGQAARIAHVDETTMRRHIKDGRFRVTMIDERQGLFSCRKSYFESYWGSRAERNKATFMKNLPGRRE